MAKQKRSGRFFRNDRIIVVPAEVGAYDHVKSVKDIAHNVHEQIEIFFEFYEKYRGVAFDVVKWTSFNDAKKIVISALKAQ